MPLATVVILLAGAAAMIGWAGWRIIPLAEAIAARTGLGQAIFGAVFVGISTSLSGAILSMYTAALGHADIAISNALGGIAAQTVFLAIGDLALPRRNLEHASASLQNLAQGALLVILLVTPMLASSLMELTVLGVSPATPLLVLTYLFGMRIVDRTKSQPMWAPTETGETQHESVAPRQEQGGTARLIVRFGLYVMVLAAAGFLAAEAGVAITQLTGLSETLVGSLFTAICTSLPELITTLTAVRRGALNLAVGGIIGGNSFDVLFLAGSDVTYRPGSIYHAMTPSHVSMICVSILMTAVLLLGMLRREKHGIGGIGFESALVLALYAFWLVTIIV